MVPVIAAIIFGALVLIFLCCGVFSVLISQPSQPSAEQLRQRWIGDFTRAMNENKQQIFNSFHPVGTAKQIVVHDVQPQTGTGGQPLLAIRYTIYWEGPVTKDGFTTVLFSYDCDSGRNVGTEVLSTNGVTNEDAGEMMLDFLRGFLNEVGRQEAARRHGR